MSVTRFAADRMLGRTAKWLRILGYDTVFDPGMDESAVRGYLKEGRTVLTKGKRFSGLGCGKVIFLKSDLAADQIEELIRKGLIRVDGSEGFGLCSTCNVRLDKATPSEVRESVPEYVYHTHLEFRRCPSCGRVYWPGTHYRNMVSTVRKILSGVG